MGDSASHQCLWLFSPWSPSLGSPPPGHLPQSVTLRVLGKLEILLPPLTGLGGPFPCQLPSRLAPYPHPSPERTWHEDQCPVLGGGSLIPISSYIGHALKAQAPSPSPGYSAEGPPWLCWQDFGVQGRPPLHGGVRSHNPEGSQTSALHGCGLMALWELSTDLFLYGTCSLDRGRRPATLQLPHLSPSREGRGWWWGVVPLTNSGHVFIFRGFYMQDKVIKTCL